MKFSNLKQQKNSELLNIYLDMKVEKTHVANNNNLIVDNQTTLELFKSADNLDTNYNFQMISDYKNSLLAKKLERR